MVIEILEFIFRSFWTWIGTVILCNAIFGNLRGIVTQSITNYRKSTKKSKKVEEV